MPKPDSDCRCHSCGRCYHDHGGLVHSWSDPRPCPGSYSVGGGSYVRIWCVLRKGHFGQCDFGGH